MYNTKYICTYNDDNIFNENEKNIISEKDREFVTDALYRNDILHIFNIEDFDLDQINKELENLYEKIKDCNELILILKKVANTCLSEDLQIGLSLLFTFDFLYLTHPIISEYIENKNISREKINKLNNLILNFIN